MFKSQCPDAYSWQFDDLASKNLLFNSICMYLFVKAPINVTKPITKLSSAHRINRRPIHRIHHQSNHHREMIVMVKSLILILIHVMVVICALKEKKPVAQIHMHATKHHGINVSMGNFNQNKRIIIIFLLTLCSSTSVCSNKFIRGHLSA